jgi:hypothetical protein
MSLEISTPSQPWRRKLGWLNWAVLEEVALCAHACETGWVAPVGVRAVAQNLGMTKDTAARALAALANVGIVERVNTPATGGRTRSGYRILLPEGLAFTLGEEHRTAGKNSAEAPRSEEQRERCARENSPPTAHYGSIQETTTGQPRAARRRSTPLRPLSTAGTQGHLFDPDVP